MSTKKVWNFCEKHGIQFQVSFKRNCPSCNKECRIRTDVVEATKLQLKHAKTKGDKCPYCGDKYVADMKIVMVNHRKHFWSTAQWTPFHQLYPNTPMYHCILCGFRWGEWND